MSSVFRPVWDRLCAPGRKPVIEATAIAQLPHRPHVINIAFELEDCDKVTTNSKDGEKQSSPEVREIIFNERKSSRPSRIFDRVTNLAGTKYTFFLMLATLIIWAIVGAVTGTTQTWQIVIQDASSIQCYISDTLLMRQQQNNSRNLLKLVCQVRSRNRTCKRLLQRVCQESINGSEQTSQVQISIEKELIDTADLPVENWYDRICNYVVLAIGSLFSFVIYWAGIITWIALGPRLQWGNLWQLYINTATAVELTFTTVFLQNTRHRHTQYLEKCLQSIMKADAQMELRLRELTEDIDPNPTAVISPDVVTKGNRAIDYYGAIMGSGAIVVISLIIFAIWIAIGPTMQWNSNWWLIIGTYTGLVGFVDGYVLRNDYFRSNAFADIQLQTLADEDAVLCKMLDIPVLTEPVAPTNSLHRRISQALGAVLSLPHAVLASLVVVVTVIVVASCMHWSERGQLICNTPTMIIEGFLLLVLIQAHHLSNEKRRIQFRSILVRRLMNDDQRSNRTSLQWHSASSK
jgi:low-affinity ferrous iron transport protein